ncbi:MAG TPA: hypothetical protein ENJ30_02065 [Desulfobulbaceae bacterium]|nr:hypothetical protein [Desulfobulbaceae bacterium]
MNDLIPVDTPLSVREQKELAGLEQIIKKNFLGFVAVGKALAEIRDKRLYRTEHGRTFDTYCRELWEMSRDYADRLVGAAQVMDNLTTIVSKTDDNLPKLLPTNEAQARELARLEPEDQQQVWLQVLEETKEGAPVTARRIKNRVKSFKGEVFDKARAKIEKNINDLPDRKNGIKRSEAIQKVWGSFWDQVNEERASNWRYTSRQALFDDIESLLELVGMIDGPERRERGCAMELSDREKLAKAGFRIFRLRPKKLVIEEWQERDSWVTVTGSETMQQLAARYKELMLDPMHVKG